MVVRIANGAGFLGDSIEAPRKQIESSRCDYLTLEYLAELTMSILARSREKNPQWGYARDFLLVLESLLPSLHLQSALRIVTNAGGVNPLACARAAGLTLSNDRLADCRIAAIQGDDLLPQLERLRNEGWNFPHFETGEPLRFATKDIVSANAYLGAVPIVQALGQQARIVVAGRVADASLVVGPCWHEHGWTSDNLSAIAGASVAGHLIECGAQVTGGYSTRWRKLQLEDIGYPIAEVDVDGSCVITKPEGSGGIVDALSVAQQLVYEIGDPAHYLTPDIDVDFTSVRLTDLGNDRVRVMGARGQLPPSTYKVSLAYRAGFFAAGQLLVAGRDCVDKAHECADIIRRKLSRYGVPRDQLSVELLGTGESARLGANLKIRCEPPEVVLRIAMRDSQREPVERFTREIAPLITSGPAGLAGYASGRPDVQTVFAYWPTTIPRELVESQVIVRPAADWAAEARI